MCKWLISNTQPWQNLFKVKLKRKKITHMLVINQLCTDAHYPPTAALEGLSLQWEKVHFMWVSEPVQTLTFSCTKLITTYIQSRSTQMIQVWRMLHTSNLTSQTQFNLTHGLTQIRYTGLKFLKFLCLLNERDWVRYMKIVMFELETDLHNMHDLPWAQKGLVVCKAKVLHSFHWSSSGNRSHDLSSCNQAFYWLS